MGLFSKISDAFEKKECIFCGKEIGLLGKKKLEDGVMCKDCVSLLSPWFGDRKSSTVAEIEQQLKSLGFGYHRFYYLLPGGGVFHEGRLPTLEEYIGICAKYGKTAVLELKNHMDGRDVEAVVRSIRELGWLERTVFISFDLPNLISLRELLPAQKAQYLIEEHVPADLMDTLARWRLDLDIHHPMLTAEMCRKIHAMGLEVNVWTVNTPEDARRVTEAGADYITTNILE